MQWLDVETPGEEWETFDDVCNVYIEDCHNSGILKIKCMPKNRRLKHPKGIAMQYLLEECLPNLPLISNHSVNYPRP